MKNRRKTDDIKVFFLTALIFSVIALTTLPQEGRLYYESPGFAEYVFSFTFVAIIIVFIFGIIMKHRGH